jgi:peptide chain release factor
MDLRSQHQNKKVATERLIQKLELNTVNQLKNQFQTTWTNQMLIQRGNPIRVFEGSDFKREKTTKSFKKERQQFKKQDRDEINR